MPSAGRDSLLEKIPSTDETLRSLEIQALVLRDGRKAVTTAVRKILERIRFEISRGRLRLFAYSTSLDVQSMLRRAEDLAFLMPSALN